MDMCGTVSDGMTVLWLSHFTAVGCGIKAKSLSVIRDVLQASVDDEQESAKAIMQDKYFIWLLC
jgi:hypothetical protein